MNFLLDMPVSPALLEVIARSRLSRCSCRAHLASNAPPTVELLILAQREERVIITADLDFPRLLALSSERGPGIILFRGGNYSDQEMRNLLTVCCVKCQKINCDKSVCVVDKKRVRITPLPLIRNP